MCCEQVQNYSRNLLYNEHFEVQFLSSIVSVLLSLQLLEKKCILLTSKKCLGACKVSWIYAFVCLLIVSLTTMLC